MLIRLRNRNRSLCWFTAACLAGTTLSAQTKEELAERVAQLEQALATARTELSAATEREALATERATLAENSLAETETASSTSSKIQIGGLSIGGAIRANYYGGDYSSNGLAKDMNRGDAGTISLDTFRLNADYANGPWRAKFEYRFYPGYSGSNSDGYSFLHTGWLGYDFASGDQVQVGVNRVPFGPGAYGISQSWFFDQHYYVGLSDDMDLGIKYVAQRGDWSFDFAYYYADEGSYFGENFSSDSVRYSYDVVNETGDGYQERNQVNLRAIYAADLGHGITADLGASAQFGLLESQGGQDDGEHYAFSFHPVFKWSNWTLATQLTYYKYAIDGYVDTTDDGIDNPTDTLVQFGAYDFATFAAAEAWIAGVSLSYYYEVNAVDWLDYIVPYIEYSSIMKTESGFNDSDLFVVGSAWARGGWYIYTEVAASNGNDFIGNEAGYGDPTSGATNDDGVFQSSRFGANPTNEWETRFNINFGYYF
ncbi:hypothetical protein SH580_11295 [Coraliomargarita algicola]|uniref:Carbohydrate porin n=1 Tax=Coraliomargarita algicola TaxID=3092156 RepID=A0ABZ0RG32_9BACT|nr:hypothetical protein [Coraliomargarita sp. J2-16]WPJ94018.1 hypothetical protein SH580_11295 [Coraliomargarita sp. J2-16]